MRPSTMLALVVAAVAVSAAVAAPAASGQAAASAAPGQAAAGPAPAAQVSEPARRAAIDGRFLLLQGRVDEAIDKLEMALALAPGYPEAVSLLAEAKSRRQQAQQHYDRAAALAREGKWDEALLEIDAALQPYGSYAQAKDLLKDIRRRAADSYVAAGAALADSGDLPAADAAYRRSMDYAPDSAAAREGLARVDALRAEAALGRNFWGAALLWATEAVEYAPKKAEYQELAAAARARVVDRIRLTVGPDPEGGAVPTATTADLRAAIWQHLAAAAPAFLAVLAGPGAPGPAAFTAAADVTSLEVGPEQMRVENRTQRYAVERQEPNPDYARVVDSLAAANDYLTRLRADYDRPCPFCGGLGWTVCRACGGTGIVPGVPAGACPVCAASGRPGWIRCPRCFGFGRFSSVSITDLRRQEQEVARLQNLLARTSPTIVRQVPADWPYAVEFHERSGTVEAALRVTDRGAGRVVLADAVRKNKRFDDTAIQNANPAIGLAPKALRMPSDEKIRAAILDEAAGEAAARIIAAVAGARAAERLAESERLMAAGKTAEAVEAGVDAAILTEPINRDGAAQLMQSLRERLRTEGRPPAPPAAKVPPPPPSPI
jgi:tetratricopeptide (TPR) repeat protein